MTIFKHLIFPIASIFLFIGDTFALPGDPVAFGALSGGCGEQVENPLDDNLRGMVGTFQCQGFEKDEVHDMCECMETSYGDEIKKSEDYKNFKSQLMDFDTFETAMVEFNQDVDSIEMATLANFIAAQDPSLGNPFQNGGACADKFSKHQEMINEGTGVNFDLSPIVSWMDSHKREDYLMSQGLGADTLSKSLEEFWRVLPSSESGPVIVDRSNEEGINRIIKYLYNGAYEKRAGESIHQKLSENLSSSVASEEFHSLSKKDALDILCNGLISRFEEMLVENEAFKPARRDTIIDRENTLTDRMLYSTDIEAFRGLRTRYLSSNESDNSVLYFNQRFCESLKKDETSENVSRPTDPMITSASDEKLKQIIEIRNDFFEMVGEQIEAGNVQYDEHFRYRDESEELLKEKLAEVGLDWSDFSAKMSNLSEDEDPIDAFNERLAYIKPEGIEPEKLQEILRYASQFHVDNQEMIKIATRFASLQEAYAVGQTNYDAALRELLHRKGTIGAVQEFLGKDVMQSRTAQYYASFDQDISHDYIGPRPPIHAHMNTGNTGLYVDVVQRREEIEKRNDNGTSVVEALVAKAEEGGEYLREFREKMAETVKDSFFTGRRAGSSRSSNRSRISRREKRNRNLNIANSRSSKGAEVRIRDRQIMNKNASRVRSSQTRNLNEVNSLSEKFAKRPQVNSLTNNRRQVLRSQEQRNLPKVEDPRVRRRQNLGSSLDALERRLSDLDRRARESSSEDVNQDGKEVESEQDLALRAEIARLRGQIDSLKQASKDIDRKRKRSPVDTSVQNRANNLTRQQRRLQSGRTQRGGNRSRRPASIIAGGGTSNSSVGTGNGVSSANISTSPALSSASSGSSIRTQRGGRLDRPTGNSSDPGTESSSTGGISLRLVSESVGFAEVRPNQAIGNPVEIGIDFLSLPDEKKATFIEDFFGERGESKAVLRQRDGRVILIERSSSQAKRRLAREREGVSSDAVDVRRNDRGMIHRVKTMNNALDDFLGTFEP